MQLRCGRSERFLGRVIARAVGGLRPRDYTTCSVGRSRLHDLCDRTHAEGLRGAVSGTCAWALIPSSSPWWEVIFVMSVNLLNYPEPLGRPIVCDMTLPQSPA